MLLLRRLLAAICVAAFVSVGSGCVTSPAKVIKEACDPGSLVEVCAFGIYGTYAVLLEQSADLVEDPNTDPVVVGAIKRFTQHSTPTMKLLRDSALEVEKARKAYAAGTGTVEKLVIVSRELTGWIAKGTSIVDRFRKLIGK